MASGAGLETPQGARAFGEYELLEELGRGGMGVVYRAWQPRLERSVALKLLLAGPFASPEFSERFRREALMAARLHHPGIAAIHEAGEQDGQAYYTMELVEGRTLAALIRDGLPPPREAAALLEKTARAVAHAHAQGVLHRDLKPSNILIAADGQPKVADFGLARVVQNADAAADGLTLSTALLGSPPYMAPEQAEGHAAVETTDVYALGAVFYELLTGRPPHQGSSPQEILTHVREAVIVEPRRLVPPVPRDLETVCLKCLEREPARRYPTAAALADDLSRFLRGDAVHARPVGAWGKTWRWCVRRPAVAASLALTTGALVAVAVVSVLASERMRQTAESARSAETAARESLRLSLISEARTRLFTTEAGRQFETVDLLRRAEAIAPSPEITPLAVSALAGADLKIRQRLDWHDEDGYYSTASRDHSLLALLHKDGRATLRRTTDGVILYTISQIPGGFTEYPQLSPGSALMAIRGADDRLRIYRWADAACLLDTPCLCVSGFGGADDAGASLVLVDDAEKVRRWTAEGGMGPAWPGLTAGRRVALSIDGRRAAVPMPARPEVAICNTLTGLVEWRLRNSKELGKLNFLTWDPSSRFLAVTDGERFFVFDVTEHQVSSSWVLPGASARRLAFTPDGRHLASAGWDPWLRIFDWRRGIKVVAARHSGENLSFSDDGSTLFQDKWDSRQSVLWDFSTGAGWHGVTRLETPSEGAGRVRRGDVAFDPSGRFLVCGSGSAIEWRRADNGVPLARVPVGDVLTVAFHPYDKALIFGTRRGLMRLPWREESGTLHLGPAEPLWTESTACLLNFSPDGTRAAAWSFTWERSWEGQHLRVFDAATWKVVACSQGVDTEPRMPQWSPDGRWLAEHLWHGAAATVFDPRTGGVVWEGNYETSFSGPRWTPEGTLFCPGAESESFVEAGTWRTLKRRTLDPLSGDYLITAAFSPHGLRAEARSGGVMHLTTWPESRLLAETRTTSGEDVKWLGFSPDGRRLAMVDSGGGLLLWDIAATARAELKAGLPSPLLAILPKEAAAPPPDFPTAVKVEIVAPERVAQSRARAAAAMPARSVLAPPGCIDLTAHCNTLLTDQHALEPGGAVDKGWDFSALPPGLHRLGGQYFEVRGLIVLNSGDWLPSAPDRPAECRGIPIGRKVRRLHLLLGSVSDTDGEVIAAAVLHLTDSSLAEIPLRIGEELDCSILAEGLPPATGGASGVAWTHAHKALGPNRAVRLYRYTWANRFPDVSVETLDFISAMKHGGLVIAGVTVE